MATNDPLIHRSFAGAFADGALESVGSIRRQDLVPEGHWDADLVALEIPLSDRHRFARAGFMILPRWIAMEVDLREPEHVLWDARKRETVHRIDRSNLVLEVERSSDAAEMFHERMYAPLARARHGRRAIVVRPAYIRAALRSGWVLFVRSGRERKAALLVVPRPGFERALDILLFGVLDGSYQDTELEREAAYLFALRWARDMRRATRVGMTGAAPFLRDGILLFKKRWGARAALDLRQPTCIAVRVQSGPPEVCVALAKEPLIALRENQGEPRLSSVIPRIDGEPSPKTPRVPDIDIEELALGSPADLPVAIGRWATEP